MQPTKFVSIQTLCGLFLAGSLIAAQAQGVTVTNTGAGQSLNNAGEWLGSSGNGAPTSANIAVWNSVDQSDLTEALGANSSWAGIQILNPGGPITVSAGNTLTLGALGIDLSQATEGLTLACPVALGASQTWNVTTGQALTNSGAISGSGELFLNNGANYGGTIVLAVANTYNGGTVISNGIIMPENATSFGTGGLTNLGGVWELSSFPASGIIANQIVVSNTVMIDMNNAGSSFVFDGSWSGNATILVTNETGSGSTLTFGGNSTPGNMANFSGSIIVVTNASGTANAGTIRFNNGGGLNNIGNSAMSINLGGTAAGGPASTVALVNRDAGTTSVGELTGGPGTTATGQTSGNGTVTWSIGGRNTSVSFAGGFVNHSSTAIAALAKVGTGTFTLNGSANTYTGPTTVSGGTLQIGDGGADGSIGTGAISIGSSGTLAFDSSLGFSLANAISGGGPIMILGGTPITYTGTDTASGPLDINNGYFTVSGAGSVSGPVNISAGSTFDVSAISYNLSATLSGSGAVNGNVAAGSGSTVFPGGTGIAGTLTFTNTLAESGGVINEFVLSSPSSTNDLINVLGTLSLSGVNTITLSHFGGGTIPIGVYPLIQYGSLSGGTNNFSVTAVGVTGTLTNITTTTPPEIAVIISQTVRGATNLTWQGDGVLNDWDITSSNWFNGAVSYAFQAGDSVLFNDAGTPNTNVDVVVAAQPAAVTFSNTLHYTLSGSGYIGGAATGLIKTNSGTVTLLTTNTYAGPTIIGQGTLEVQNIGLSGSASGIGEASSNPTNWVMYGSTFLYSGPSASTDHGATLNGTGGTFDVIGGTTLTLSGTIAGPGALTLIDAGTLTLANTSANTYSGGTVLSNGVLATANQAANASGFGPTSSPITFDGGTLTLFNTSDDGNTYSFNNPMVVPAGQTGNLNVFARGSVNGNLTGGGLLNITNTGPGRAAFGGDWSQFTGVINVTGGFRIANTTGYSNAVFYISSGDLDGGLDSGVYSSVAIFDIGELDGPTGATLGSVSKPTPYPIWRVGWKNTTSTLAGNIQDASGGYTSITKVGTGTWFLSGQNTFTGPTTITSGVLSLTNMGNGDGSISDSTNIYINAGAFLDVSGLSSDTLYLQASQVLCGDGTLNGILDNTAGGTVSGGTGIDPTVGTLTVTKAVNLGGSGTAWMKLNPGHTPNSDQLVSALSTITYGGTLVITNIGSAPQVGDQFTLFSGAGLSGTFGTIIVPNYYKFDLSKLGVNGTITLTNAFRPAFSSVNFSALASGSVTLNITNGVANGLVNVLTSTNLSLPLSSWTINSTANFDVNGNLNSDTISVDNTQQQLYIMLQAQ